MIPSLVTMLDFRLIFVHCKLQMICNYIHEHGGLEDEERVIDSDFESGSHIEIYSHRNPTCTIYHFLAGLTSGDLDR